MSHALRSFVIPVPINNIDNYIRAANATPFLTEEEEKELANRWFYEQDVTAAKQLVLSHLRAVIKIARGFSGYGLNFADLIQEGNIGLMKAVKRFDPTMGVRLISFAIHWIKAEMHSFIIKNWRIVKIATTKAQRKLFFNLRSLKNRFNWCNEDEVNMISEELNVKPAIVREMELRLAAQDHPFEGPAEIDAQHDSALFIPAEFLHAQEADPALLLEQEQKEALLQEKLIPALKTLNSREQEIVHSRWLGEGKTTFKTLADKFSVSIERIRQIEENAFRKLRDALIEH